MSWKIVLVLYGVIVTFQIFSSFHRVYAACGVIFIILSVLRGGNKKASDLYDWLGMVICLAGF
ncbi:hypothetical protein [Domibacillus robiginosus]|uniref:hypothetical protein n=1 Tax=Domibacillus robiginosus TaxID=1071054 RepID=UPI001FE00EC9|nr:hypothetical protein [Domibacillus robiginosus]